MPQRSGGYGRVHVAGARVPPRPSAVHRGGAGARQVETAPAECADSGSWSLPLPPDEAA